MLRQFVNSQAETVPRLAMECSHRISMQPLNLGLATYSAIQRRYFSYQSERAHTAQQRAHGMGYRMPKGSPRKNAYQYIKEEPIPEVQRFAPAQFSAAIMRRKSARIHKELAKFHRAQRAGGAAAMFQTEFETPIPILMFEKKIQQETQALQKRKRERSINFEIDPISNDIVPIRGKDHKPIEQIRVKSPVHRQIRLNEARSQIEAMELDEDLPAKKLTPKEKREIRKVRKLAKAQELLENSEQSTATYSWEQSDQNSAELAANEFFQQELADFRKLKVDFERELDGLLELGEIDQATREAESEAFDLDLEHLVDASRKKYAEEAVTTYSTFESKPKRSRSLAAPTFSIQGVLSFLRQQDVIVKFSSYSPSSLTSAPAVRFNDKSAAFEATLVQKYSNPLNQDIIVYDAISRFQFADYIVVVKASSARQMRYLAESVYRLARGLNACSELPRTLSIEGRDRDDWMLVDTGRIWLYFFNKTPIYSLPTTSNSISTSDATSPSVDFTVHQKVLNLDPLHSLLAAHQIGVLKNVSAESSPTPDESLPFLPNKTHTSFRLVPKDEDNLETSTYLKPELTPYESPSVLQNSSPDKVWYAATPDLNSSGRKKSLANQLEARKQLKTSLTEEAEALETSDQLRLLENSNFTHDVLRSLEKHYGDLRVPPHKIESLKDYLHENLDKGLKFVGEKLTKSAMKAGRIEQVEVKHREE